MFTRRDLCAPHQAINAVTETRLWAFVFLPKDVLTLCGRRHRDRMAVPLRVVGFSAHPQPMQQPRQLSCGAESGADSHEASRPKERELPLLFVSAAEILTIQLWQDRSFRASGISARAGNAGLDSLRPTLQIS